MRFSERIGAVKPVKSLQVDEMSNELRNSLWNIFYDVYEELHEKYWRSVAQHIARHFKRFPLDELPRYTDGLRKWVKSFFFSQSWYDPYDLVELLVNDHYQITEIKQDGYRHQHHFSQKQLIEIINFILERELSGFRFISGVLAPISDKVEVREIESAVESASLHGLTGANEHIRTALDHLGKKPNPDHRNAIKEAISAVESVVKQISGSSAGGLEDALRELSEKSEIHGALKAGFIKLYGYTSDEDGIRHAILDQPNVGFDESKYMIVSCSAFVNYLIAKADKAGLLGKS
jgi:hypothetical protein